MLSAVSNRPPHLILYHCITYLFSSRGMLAWLLLFGLWWGLRNIAFMTANLAARKSYHYIDFGAFSAIPGVVFVSEHSECSEVYDECVMPTNSATPWGLRWFLPWRALICWGMTSLSMSRDTCSCDGVHILAVPPCGTSRLSGQRDMR